MNAIKTRLQNIRFPRLSSIDLSEVRTRASQAIRARSLYARVTLTPFTLFYFLFAFLTCVIMVALQAVAFADNTFAVNTISPIIAKANVSHGLALTANGVLQYCDGISHTNAAHCKPIISQTTNASAGGFILTWRRDLQVPRAIEDSRHIDGAQYNRRSTDRATAYMRYRARNLWQKSQLKQAALPAKLPSPSPSPTPAPSAGTQQIACAQTLIWLKGSLNDENRENIVTLAFQFWLFSLAAVAILSESLPHLGAALAGHILGTGWAGYRVQSSYKMLDTYKHQVVAGACGGFDPLTNWWQVKIAHSVPIVISNGVAMALMLFLSYKVYRFYSNRTFSSVGTTPAVERILKIVLLFSVCLHLTVFFVIASTAVWINKINGMISFLATDNKAFLVVSAITLIAIFPWMFIGWVSVRRECHRRFLGFCILSVLLLTMFTMLFWSGLFRFTFSSWPFFATITVTAYVLVTLSTIFAIWCRFNFGRGFAHFIQVSEVLENMDFPSVYFSKEGMAENGMRSVAGQQPHVPPVTTNGLRTARFMRASVYSNNNVATVKLSTSQPLHSELVNTVVSPTSPTFKRTASTITVTQRLRRVFEYRRSNASNTSGTAEATTTPVPIPQSPKPILTSQIAQQSRLQPLRPPPLQLRGEDDNSDTGRGRKNTDKAKRRSRSMSIGQMSRSMAMETIAESIILDLPPMPKSSGRTRPLPVRPLPRPPSSAPLSSNESHSGAPLVRRGGMRDPRPFEQQW